MKVDKLKNFLRLRGLKTAGRRCEVVARVFFPIKRNVPLVKTTEEIEKELALGYKANFVIENALIPDSFKTTDECFGEKDGVAY